MSGNAFNSGGFRGGYGQNPWARTYTPNIPGATPDNPTARPDFYGTGPFNIMAFQQSPFGAPDPYGGFYPRSNFGGSFAPFGSTTGGAFNRGGNGTLYRPGGYGYGGKYGGGSPFGFRRGGGMWL